MRLIEYYEVLELSREAELNDIKKQYRKLALKFHPSKAEGSKEQREKFRLISESYEVLSNPQLRAVYDQYGFEGLKRGIEGTATSESVEPYCFGGNCKEIFEGFFGSNNPYADFFYEPGSVDNSIAFHDGAARGIGGLECKQDPPQVKDLDLTLEEMYKGCQKKVKVTRSIISPDAESEEEEELVMTINCKPGWRDGTKVTFPKMSHQGPNSIPGDLVFMVKQKPHEKFTRKANDLFLHSKVSLCESLTGCTVKVDSVDGRKLSIPVADLITPGYSKIVPGEGMPDPKNPAVKGNLVLTFEVNYPSALNDSQKILLRKALSNA
eukprot:Nk52_evm34s62 gene=Nk52_evmTU34s62